MPAIITDSWIRTDDYGEIEQLESESIVTSFYEVLIPIWPEHSAYVIRGADGSEQRLEIPLQPRSVVLGYLRVLTWLTALVLGLGGLMRPERWAWLLIPTGVLVIVAAVLTFGAGRLRDSELDRRRRLRRVVGFGAPPELLTVGLRTEVQATLVMRWDARNPSISWPDAIERGDVSDLLIALAEYHQDAELVALALANFDNKIWN